MNRVFKQGDIIFVSFDPSKGQEQKGVRPAMVISIEELNRISNRVIVAAISNGAVFHRNAGLTVSLMGAGLKTSGVVICDQIRTLDIVERKAAFVEQVPDYIIDEVLAKIALSLGIES